MTNVSDIIKKRRKELGLTLSQIADAVGVTEATVQRWESGNIKNLRYERLEPLSNALRVSPSFLMGWQKTNINPPPETIKKPRLGAIACGQPILAEEHIDDYDDVPVAISCDFTLICVGDSMTGAGIQDGDIVYIRQQPIVNNGDIAAVLIDGEATLKRFRRVGETVMLLAENPNFDPMIYNNSEINKIQIIGKAVGFTREFKK